MSDVAGEFEAHGKFEREASASGDERAFAPTVNDWDATASVDGDAVEIEVRVPTLQAATEEDVADVVTDGWYDTFERRVADADSVTLADDVTVEAVERRGGEIVVVLSLTPRDGKAADDALALVNYVEGTWFEGVIPGYDYRDDVQELRDRAHQQGQDTPL
jgi:hypothetical protein